MEIFAIFEVYDGNFWLYCGVFGFFVEGDEGRVRGCKIIISDGGGGGAKDAGDFFGFGDKTGETDGGVFGGVFLVIGGFVGFVNDDETEVF